MIGVTILLGGALFHFLQRAQAGYPVGFGSMGGGGQFMGGAGYGIGGMGFGGSEMANSFYDGGNKNFNDLFFKKGFGSQGGQFNNGQFGFAKGEGLIKDIKGDSGYYSGVNGGKNLFEDGRAYHGAQHFGKGGINQGQEKEKKGHKKGHTVKGYKTSHQSDEASNTEEVYDEEHDEADHKAISGEKGKFGENNQESHQGEKEDIKFNKGEAKKEGKYENAYLAEKLNAEQGKYGQNKFLGDGTSYAVNNGGNINNNVGHEQSNKFYKHYPNYV